MNRTETLRTEEEIAEAAQDKGIIIRILGSGAAMIHCPLHRDLFEQLNRPITDIDMITYRKFSSVITEVCMNFGFSPDERFNLLHGESRQIYHKRDLTLEIYFDKLEMCHTVDFKGRLELDFPTITLADFLLEKIQIVNINEKDIKDVTIVLSEHEVGSENKETVDADYIAKKLSNDWGFYYTASVNLVKIANYLYKFEVLDEKDRKNVKLRIDKINKRIEEEPKSLGWKLRAKVGTNKKWYREVEEIVR